MRTYLRSIEPGDAEIIARWKSDPYLRKMALDPNHTTTAEKECENIQQALDNSDEEYLLILEQKTDQPLGYIRLNWWHGREVAWLRYAMGERRGEGFCSEAVAALLEQLFGESLHRIEGEVYACNEPSIRLLEQLGFVREGVKRQAHFDGEEYLDIFAYGLLRADFTP